jgi:hypothetical protein
MKDEERALEATDRQSQVDVRNGQAGREKEVSHGFGLS